MSPRLCRCRDLRSAHDTYTQETHRCYCMLEEYADASTEVARASENLAKSGKTFGTHARRESMPSGGSFSRQFPEIGN